MSGFGGYRYGGGPWGRGTPPFISLSSGIDIFNADNISVAGGDQFFISGLTDFNTIYEDYFESGPLSTNWTSSGSYAIDNGIQLSVDSPSGGMSYIRSTTLFKNTDINVNFSYDDSVEDLSPQITISHLKIRLLIDADNYVSLEQIWDPDLGKAIRFSVTTNASTVEILKSRALTQSKTLRLVRLYGDLIIYSGATRLTVLNGWRTEDVTVELSTSSPSNLPRDLHTTIRSFIPRHMVEFSGYLSDSITLVANSRLYGLAPAVELPGLYEVIIHTVENSVSLGLGSAVYIPVQQLTLTSQNSGVALIINDEKSIKDSTPDLRGLRL